VLFELTMLGAIIATVLSLLITTELPTKKVKLYDPAVSQGKILVAVEEPPDDALPKLQRVLREAKTVR